MKSVSALPSRLMVYAAKKVSLGLLVVMLLLPACGQEQDEGAPDAGVQGGQALDVTAADKNVDEKSGLVIADGWEIVKALCTSCHSSKLITQNHATRKGWLDLIRWMQKTQGLSRLGELEPAVLDYLAENYGVPERYRSMRRQPLSKDQLP